MGPAHLNRDCLPNSPSAWGLAPVSTRPRCSRPLGVADSVPCSETSCLVSVLFPAGVQFSRPRYLPFCFLCLREKITFLLFYYFLLKRHLSVLDFFLFVCIAS